MYLDDNVLPLIIASFILIGFTGLEWWRWYFDIPTTFPILLTGIALSLGTYYYRKLISCRKYDDKQENLRIITDQHSESHQKDIS